jgi:hypothetical protein
MRHLKNSATWCAVFALGMMLAAPAAADVIFSDDFNRPNSDIVGMGWVETENPAEPDDVAIAVESLRLRDFQPDAAATQFLISTIGYENITLSYEWLGLQVESGDELLSQWKRSSDTDWITLLTHDLSTHDTLTPAFAELGPTASNTMIDFRFLLNVNENAERARVDNVLLEGDLIAAQVPEPSTIALLGVVLAGLGFSRRKRIAN